MTTTQILKKIFLLIFLVVIHLLAIGVLGFMIWPIAKWYLNAIPVKGIDLYLSASYVAQLLKHFSLRFTGWKEIWFSGQPFALDYPMYYFYTMIPLVKHFGLVQGIQWFAMLALAVFCVFSYFLYYQLAKNPALALVLTLATAFSVNLYRALVWAGGVPFWATQAFFPIVIFLVVKYCQSSQSKWLFLAALASGLGVMGHPQGFLNLIFPAALLIIFFYRSELRKVTFKKRILDLGLYILLTILTSSGYTIDLIPSQLSRVFSLLSAPASFSSPASTGGAAPNSPLLNDIHEWSKAQFQIIWSSDTNILIWYLLGAAGGLWLLSMVLRKKRWRALLNFLPFGLTFGWVVGLTFLFSRGIDFLSLGGWYKVFWMILVVSAMWVAMLFGEAKKVFQERKLFKNRILKLLIGFGEICLSIIILIWGYYFLPNAQNFIASLEKVSIYSSAFPEVLNAKTKPEELLELAQKLKPNLIANDLHDYRLYIIDATVNIWWNALEDMALARGYVDPPLTPQQRWGLFWLDAVLGPASKESESSLIGDWKTPAWVVENNAYFLLDWYAVKYLEGNHGSATPSQFATNITTDKFIQSQERIETQGGVVNRYSENEHWDNNTPQFLQFYQFKDYLVSPILTATNAAPVMHVGSNSGYDTLSRWLGMMNLGPRNLILTRGPQFLDDLSYDDLANFEALILYQYDYRNANSWRFISRYLEKGGRVFIDTGTETKDSNSINDKKGANLELPQIFPFKRSIREDLGKDWDIRYGQSELTRNIDFNKFSPLVYDNGPWNISHPPSQEDLREGTEVILRQKGTAVLAQRKIGNGLVIWSGFNLPYHVIRDYNSEEGKLLQNIFGQLVDLNGGGSQPAKTYWISPKERLIETEKAKGILFKEQGFPVWQAKSLNNKLKVYLTGPSSPGFMYVRLPEGFSGQIRFTYKPTLKAKIYAVMSTLTILFILDYVSGIKLLITISRRILSIFKRSFSHWWEKDDA